jgi:predicted DNA-binding protein (MmcQ/YjbR family)
MTARRGAATPDGTRVSTHPPKVRTAAELAIMQRLRELALAIPSTHEVEAWGEPTFRIVGGKMFAMFSTSSTHHGGGRPAVWIKSTSVNQQLLITANPARIFSPPYVGASGWIGVYLDKRPKWSMVRELLEDGWRLVAPKKLLKLSS